MLPRISGRDQHLASYNFAFDERLIRRSLDLGGPAAGSWHLPVERSHCIMEIYARYHGAGANTTTATPCRVLATPWPNAGWSSRANPTAP